MKNMLVEQIRKLKHSKTQPNLNRPIATPKAYIPQQKITQKSNSSKPVSVKSTTSRSKAPSLNLFKGYTFCFPMVDIDLSPKRVECMSKSIVYEGGKVVVFNDKRIDQKVDLVLINPKTSIHLILKKIHNKIEFSQIMDYNFVLHCMREQVLLSISNYSLYKNRQNQEEEEEQQKTVTMSLPPQKMVKCEDKAEGRRVRMMERVEYERPKKLQVETDAEEEQQTRTMNATAKINIPQFSFTQQEQLQEYPPPAPKQKLNREAFLCQKPATFHQPAFSMNKFICDQLMKLQKIYESQKDIGRKIAYLKAVSAIKTLDKEIESEHDVENLRGVGSKIIKKVKELLQTGRLEKLERLQTNERRVVIETFCKIWGVGPSKAEQLYQKGIRSIDELKKNPELLNINQTIGLKYFQDFQTKIPREKATRIFECVKDTFSRIGECQSMYHLEVCGSYRRGRAFCGDIDILISRKDGKYEKRLLLDLVLELERVGLLTDHLVFPSSSKEHKSLSYMGVCQLDEFIHHRIDIKYYPIEEYPYALLYFTGSDMFNRSMRLYASKLGIQLNDHGAFARRRNPNDDFWDKPIPVCRNEKEIFDFLGMDYKTPHERDV